MNKEKVILVYNEFKNFMPEDKESHISFLKLLKDKGQLHYLKDAEGLTDEERNYILKNM